MIVFNGGGVFGGTGGGVSGSGSAGRLSLWSSASGLTSDAGLTYSGTGTGTVLRIGSTGTGLSEISAGVVGVGTGAAGSVAGTVVAAKHAIWGATDTFMDYGGAQSAGYIRFYESSTPVAILGANSGSNVRGLMLSSGYRLSWGTIGGLPDLFLQRRAADTFQFGYEDNGAPQPQTLTVQGATGTNIAGQDWTVTGSLGTGTAASGKLVFKVGTPQLTGTTQHVAADVLTLQNTGAGALSNPEAVVSGRVVARNHAVSLTADAAIQFGQTVMPDAGTDGRFDINTGSATTAIGVLAGIGPSVQGTAYPVAVGGLAYVCPATGQNVTRGHFLVQSATAGVVDDSATIGAAGLTIGKSLYSEAADVLVSATATTDVIVLTSAPGWAVGDPVVYYEAGGAAIAGLTSGNVYWIKTISSADVTLSATRGGAVVDITADGTISTQYLQRLPQAIINIQ